MRLRAGVERALRHFERHLRSPFRERWGAYPVSSVTTTAQPSATNAVMTLSAGTSTINTSSLVMVNSIAANPTVPGPLRVRPKNGTTESS